MSRALKRKVFVNAGLEALTPLSVGGAGASETADLELAKNGKGEWYIPSTSMTGPMRSWLETRFERGEAIAAALFGYQNRRTGGGRASLLFVGDAPVNVPRGLAREVRDGIRMDRVTGTAKKGFKYNRAVLPAGTTMPLRLELDVPPEPVEVRRENASEKEIVRPEELERAVREIVRALGQGEIRFGAAKGRGLGSLRVRDSHFFRYNFPEDLDRWLDREVVQRLSLDKLGNDVTLERKKIFRDEIVIEWTPVSPVMVKSGRDGTKADMVPLVSGVANDKVAPVLPGSSLKGILRGRAEKIIRTLLLKDDQDERKEEECLEIVREIFGDEDRGGRMVINDVYQRGGATLLSAWFGEEKDFESATTYEQHVAVDRFTGGASDGALYSVRAPKIGPKWDPIRIVVDFSRPVKVTKKSGNSPGNLAYVPVSAEHRNAMRALLYLVLRDMKEGFLPLGFGANRGMGEINIIGMKGYDDFSEEEKGAMRSAWESFLKTGGDWYDCGAEAERDPQGEEGGRGEHGGVSAAGGPDVSEPIFCGTGVFSFLGRIWPSRKERELDSGPEGPVRRR